MKLSFADIRKRLDAIVEPGKTYYGVPRGGEIIANMLAPEMLAATPNEADVILAGLDVISDGE